MAAKKQNIWPWLIGGGVVVWYLSQQGTPTTLPPSAATYTPPVALPGSSTPGGALPAGGGAGGTPIAVLPAPGPGAATNYGGAGGSGTQIPPSNAPLNTTPVTSAPVSSLPGVQSPLGNNDAEEIMEQNGDYKMMAPGVQAPPTKMMY